ncbi:MAG: prepilin-type N-terminal cleavage/methylation domain-containing protein [Planctomycetes bacterium]|nr:prepilin-type N-terminal cleavage/methylation domain-containing protein [Planctomycetota bacterium]
MLTTIPGSCIPELRAAPRRASGFTLIELMIAISLSAVIVMVAVTAFRQAAQTMAVVNRLSVENVLLRTGYFINTEHVDFWNSHANPDFPYGKGHMSDEVVRAGDGGNNIDNKRLFRPVAFHKPDKDGVDFDPNWELPHDARSWYRNYLTANPTPLVYDRSLGNPTDGYPVGKVFWDSAEDAAKSLDKVQAGMMQLPLGWAPWHIVGDYSAISAVNLQYAGVSAPDYGDAAALRPDAPGLRGARPNLIWQLFKQLGHTGVYTYMPPGTINLIQCPSINDTEAAIGDPSRNWCKGEIPWSLSLMPSTGKTRCGSWPNGGRVITCSQLPTVVSCPSTAQVPDNSKGNYFLGMPASNSRICFHPDGGNQYQQGGIAAYDEAYGGSVPHYAADLDWINGDSMYLASGGAWSNWTQLQARLSVGLMYGTRFVPANIQCTSFDADPLIDATTRDPFRSLDKEISNFAGQFTQRATSFEASARTMTFWKQQLNYGSRTVHLPRNLTDDPAPNLTDKAESSPTMSTEILRFRYRSLDKAQCSVRVQDPISGRVIELGYTTVGSTLRGARQHWGWKSHYDQPTMKPMGDTYE